MPIVVPAGASPTSAAQVVGTTNIYDYLLTSQGSAVAKAQVTAILNADFATTITPQVMMVPREVIATETDGNGFWSMNLVPNANISPANTTYTIKTPFRSYDITVGGSGPYQSTSTGTLVSTPATLGTATSDVIGPLTVAGALTVSSGGLTVTGGLTLLTGTFSIPGGAFSMAGPLTLTAATSQIIPGATSMSLRNTLNTLDNLLVSNAGLVTARAGLVATAGGVTATAGDVAVTAGNLTLGAAASRLVPGATSFAVRDTANGNDNLLVSNAGAVTTRSTLTVTAGGLTVTSGGATVTSGNLSLTAGNLIFAAASAKILPGATSLLVRNNADSATNVSVTDAGLTTLRNAIEVPYAAAVALPTHSFGTVMVKIDDQLLAANAATITFPNPLPTGFRHLLIQVYARTDRASTSDPVILRFNNDSGANYDHQVVTGSAAAASAAEALAATSIQIGNVPAATATAAYFGQIDARVMHYQGTTGNKLVIGSSAFWSSNGSGAGQSQQWMGKWRTTATAVTRIDLISGTGANFIIGSIFTLWGIP